MSTFREVVYMVLDNNKLSNDDSYVEPEHVLYIISKLRAYLLTSKYQKMKAQISNANFQTINLTLHQDTTAPMCQDGSGMLLLKSDKKIPDLLLLNNYEGLTIVNPTGIYGMGLNFNFVNSVRFNSVGYNKWLKNQIYVTIAQDNYLYVKASNSDILDLDYITISGVFEDAEKAAKLALESNSDFCNNDGVCDIMDVEFPLEEGLITLLLENATNTVYGIMAKSKDDKNSSSDEANNIMSYINSMIKDRYRANSSSSE